MSQQEVEVKVVVKDWEALRDLLLSAGFRSQGKKKECDVYFTDAGGECARGDSVLRVRTGEDGRTEYTVKGRREGQSLARSELELKLESASASDAVAFLEVLGFHPTLEVEKEREKFVGSWEGHPLTVSCDSISGVEGAFVEAEILADLAAAPECENALRRWMSTHSNFIVREERRSYRTIVAEHLVRSLVGVSDIRWVSLDSSIGSIGPLEASLLSVIRERGEVLEESDAVIRAASGKGNGLIVSKKRGGAVPTLVVSDHKGAAGLALSPQIGLRSALGLLGWIVRS